MKIGILTYHRAHNYGAVLQCFALQKVLQSHGHVVEIIDYKQPYIEDFYTLRYSIKRIIELCLLLKLGQLTTYIKKIIDYLERKRNFENFRRQYLNCSSPFENTCIPQNYDSYILGSDQIWGLHCTNGYDPIFWGNFKRPTESKVFGYAISGTLAYHEVLLDEDIKNNVSNFDKLSFREKSLQEDILKITGVKGEICVDPTLLTDRQLWESLVNTKWHKRNYVALYQVRYDWNDVNLLNRKTEELAQKFNCEVIDLTDMKYSVEDFISIIKYAKCVVTSSFHATVFSILFDTPFYTFKLYDNHDRRCVDLLESLHLDNHLVDKKTMLSDVPKVDKQAKEKYLPLLQADSYQFLKSILS